MSKENNTKRYSIGNPPPNSLPIAKNKSSFLIIPALINKKYRPNLLDIMNHKLDKKDQKEIKKTHN